MEQGNFSERIPGCLNLVRLLAALQVLCGHCINNLKIPVSGTAYRCVYFFRGVPIFFLLSGYLIWGSVGRSGSCGQFLKKRFWRIYPELWVGVAAEILVMLTLYRGAGIGDLLLFTAGQSTVFQFWTPDSLRGYGCGTPNGALWTIGVLVQFYLAVWFIYRLLHGRRAVTWAVILTASAGLSALGEVCLPKVLPPVIFKLYGQTLLPYLWLFLAGMCIAEFKSTLLPLLKKLWPLLLAVAAAAHFSGYDLDARYTVFGNGLMAAALIGFAYTFPGLELETDISYGIFIYHMTVVNALITFSVTGHLYLIPAVAAVSCAAAYVSAKTAGKLSGRKRKELITNGDKKLQG